MKLFSLLFPVLDYLKEEPNELEVISKNNFELAKELEYNGLAPMTAQEIKEYVESKV
jgi:hypothetical protein